MPQIHVVKPKETFIGIAKAHGFGNWRAVYDHPANVKLRQARPDPGLIHPGDKIYIPDKLRKTFSLRTDQRHTLTVAAAKPEGEALLRNVTILVHGVATDAAWFKLVEAEMDNYQDCIYIGKDGVEHNLRYGIIPFSWGDYENHKQGGYPHYAVDEVRQMFRNTPISLESLEMLAPNYPITQTMQLINRVRARNSNRTLLNYLYSTVDEALKMFDNTWDRLPSPDRIYQGHAAVRLEQLIRQIRALGVQVNVIAHSNGTAVTCGALLLGATLDHVIFMGSTLDSDAARSQAEISQSIARIHGTLTNFWSSGDEWAYFKGGIGADGNNPTFRKTNPSVIRVQFYRGAVIKGVKIEEAEVDHSDYMLAPHMPIFSACIREFADVSTSCAVTYDQAKIDAWREQANWENVTYYKNKDNITLESPEMKAYEAQIQAILATPE